MILKKVKNEIGATAIEYGLIASLVAVVAVSGMSAVGGNLSNTYCTISKHLGGSGTCSGATSGSADGGGSTSGNGSGSSSTGSVNSTNSYAEGATMDEVNSSLKEQLDLTYVPTLYGGDDEGGPYDLDLRYYWDGVGDSMPTAVEYLKNINATDPITNVFGAYDTKTKQPITDYNKVLTGLQNGGKTLAPSNNDYNKGDALEVTTASGKVYTLKLASGGKIIQTEQKPK